MGNVYSTDMKQCKRWTISLYSSCPHEFQEWKVDFPHKRCDLPLLHSVMEYHHTGVGATVYVNNTVIFLSDKYTIQRSERAQFDCY